MIGTLINVGTVVSGTALGLALKRRMPAPVSSTAVQAIGLFTVFMGVNMALQTKSALIMLFSVTLGSVVGSILDIERWLARAGAALEARFGANGQGAARGFVGASLLFCVGPMAVLGSIADGVSGDYSILLTKALMDGFCSVAFGATLGFGVALSAVVILLYQGALTLAASAARVLLTDAAVREMTAAGGLLVMGIGLDMLGLKKLNVGNMLPSILVATALARIFCQG